MKNTNSIYVFILLLFSLSVFTSSETNGQKSSSIVTDIEGNKYKTIVIGNQVWMTENLKTKKLNDGTLIPNISDMTEWVRTTKPAFSWYENDISNKSIYGGLYNWQAVNTGKLCPEGWRVPSDTDWTALFEYLGGTEIAFTKLDKIDFSPVYNGYRYGYYWGSGIFYEKGINGYWWTSTKATDTHIWSRTISIKNRKIYRSYFTSNNGFSIRCVKCN